MKFKQILIVTAGIVTIVSLLTATFTSDKASAYICTGTTDGGTHSYRNGGCYRGSQLVAGEKPVKNDGSPITNWQCASGTYNASKNVCENCTRTNCTTLANVNPTPNGNDTTQAPSQPSDTTEDPDEPIKTSESGECAGVKTDFFACDGDGIDAFGSVLTMIILIVSIGVGIIAVGGLVYGAMLYASAQDNQEQTKKAIKVVRSVIVGLLLYVFMFAIANWLIPGGIIRSSEPGQSQQPPAAS